MSQMLAFTESTRSDRPAPNGLTVNARVLCSDLAALTSAWAFCGLNRKEVWMNADLFELSDCWSSEQQPAAYYRIAAARVRRLHADATTPRVKQYLGRMIVHCERLAGKVEPAFSLGSESRFPDSMRMARNRNPLQLGSRKNFRETEGVVSISGQDWMGLGTGLSLT